MNAMPQVSRDTASHDGSTGDRYPVPVSGSTTAPVCRGVDGRVRVELRGQRIRSEKATGTFAHRACDIWRPLPDFSPQRQASNRDVSPTMPKSTSGAIDRWCKRCNQSHRTDHRVCSDGATGRPDREDDRAPVARSIARRIPCSIPSSSTNRSATSCIAASIGRWSRRRCKNAARVFG